MLRALTYLNVLIAITMTAAYFYQLVYTLTGIIFRRVKTETAPAELHRFAALICARNESEVIGELIASLKNQNYPAELLDIYVLADNCTDATADLAREAGAIVFERRNLQEVGKGYALDHLLKQIDILKGIDIYDGYFIFDADNLVDADFVLEMNKTFSKGYEVITCYRNSKNFGSNWISAGYSIWFLREARFLNYPRMLFGNSCAVSGTGFFVSGSIIRENSGWPFHLLTEDIQFSVNCALTGHKIGYCDRAVVYDEQPVSFRQSWNQRLRWSKGFYQVDAKYAVPLLRGIFKSKDNKMSCYDLFMTVAPGMLLTILTVALNVFLVIGCFTQGGYMAYLILQEAFRFLFFAAVNFYFGLAAYGLLTVISEWRHIRATRARKLMFIGVFPLFMATYLPIALVALISRVEWKPIRHFATGSLGASMSEKEASRAQRAC